MVMEEKNINQLPNCAIEFIKHVVKKVRYRKKVRADVQEELITHFEDELQECKTEQERLEKAKELIKEFGDIKLLATLIRRAKKRCRPLWLKVFIRTAQVFGIILLYIFICTVPLMIGRPTIKIDYVKWLNEKQQAGREESENARVYYEKAAELLVPMPKWLSDGSYTWPTDFNDTEMKKYESWLEQNKEPLEMLRNTVNKYDFWNYYQRTSNVGDLTVDLMPDITEHLPDYRHLAFAMRENIRYEAYQGNIERAMDDCFVVTKMAYGIEGNGFLIEELVGIATEAIGIGESFRILDRVDVQPDILKKTKDELEEIYSNKKPVIIFDYEKVFWDDILQRHFTDDGNGDGRPIRSGIVYTFNTPLSSLRLLLFDYPSRKEVETAINQFFENSDKLMSKTPKDLYEEGLDANDWAEDSYGSLFLKVEEPAFFLVSQLNWNLITQRHALLTVLALFLYKDKNGQFPSDLNELVKSGYLKELPLDPFSNKPLIYKTEGNNFKLYSYGLNLKDDGGQPGKDSNGRVLKDNYNNGDWILWPVMKPEK